MFNLSNNFLFIDGAEYIIKNIYSAQKQVKLSQRVKSFILLSGNKERVSGLDSMMRNDCCSAAVTAIFVTNRRNNGRQSKQYKFLTAQLLLIQELLTGNNKPLNSASVFSWCWRVVSKLIVNRQYGPTLGCPLYRLRHTDITLGTLWLGRL